MSESTTPNNTSSWRDSVPQQYRSDEISKIATELAALEPSATMQSKLGLASRFEKLVFSQATSITDYHKKIQKRLKRMKKNYKAEDVDGVDKEIVVKKRNLRMLFGDTLRLISEHGKYVATVYPKLGEHIDRANEFAFEIGAIPSEHAVGLTSGKPFVPPKRSDSETMEHLKVIEASMERKLGTLRDYVLKYTQEDKFFGEKLEGMEKNILLNTENDHCKTFYNGLISALHQEGIADLTNLTTSELIDAINTCQKQMKETIPMPRSREDEKAASLTYLNKIRAASQLCLMYVLLSPEDQKYKLEFSGSLHAANNVVSEVLKLLKQTYKESEDEGNQSSNPSSKTEIKLEDAWSKALECDNIDEDNDDDEPEKKRLKVSQERKRKGKPLAIRAKILLIGGRKPPSNLVDALRRKRAILCQSPTGSHLKLEFGNAFEMIIYFSPLLVRIRAISAKSRNTKDQVMQSITYNVMSVSGDISLLGPLISRRLEYASAQATKCLRRCFAESEYRPKTSDFESEILEGAALLKFLTLVRNNYCPHWVDADLD